MFTASFFALIGCLKVLNAHLSNIVEAWNSWNCSQTDDCTLKFVGLYCSEFFFPSSVSSFSRRACSDFVIIVKYWCHVMINSSIWQWRMWLQFGKELNKIFSWVGNASLNSESQIKDVWTDWTIVYFVCMYSTCYFRIFPWLFE